MSMFSVAGELRKAYIQQSTFDGETRNNHYVQVLGEVPTRDGGDTKEDIVTVKVGDVRDYDAMKGERIRIAVGIYAPSKNNVFYTALRGAKPELC